MKQLQAKSYELKIKSIRKLVLSLFLLVACYLLLVSSVYADTVYTVKRGDTLHSISRKFDVSIKEIKRANNLTSNRIKAGAKLTIPAVGGQKTVSGNTETKKKKADSKEVNQVDHDDILYTVRKGDTLSKIARRFDVRVADIKEINGLTGNSIMPGQKLMIARNIEDIDSSSVVTAGSASPSHLRLEEMRKLSKSEDLLELNIRDRITLFAKKMLGLPYRFGGNSFSGIDCSAYVQKVFQLAGIDLPRTAREQFREGEPISKEELSVGDLVFFRTYASFPSHVGIYIGDNLFIHTSTRNRKVTITSLDTPYFLRRFIGAKRLIPEGGIY